MRQASWNEMFAPRRESYGITPEVPQEPDGWRRLLWWEDLLSLALLGIIYLSVIVSVDRANWVDEMPSLYLIALLGLVMGATFARLPWREPFVHLLALPIGAAAALGQILLTLPGATPWDRYWVLHERMGDWFHAAFTGGISNDELPVIVLVVPLSWLAAYLSSWAAFRWQNVWLALIPGGVVLLANISYLPGQFSFAFVVYLLGGALFITRLHLMSQSKSWRQSDTPYPPLLSLSVLHASFWLALALVIAAWLMPAANETGALESLWRRATSPITERAEGWSRLFVAVNSPGSARVHSFDDIVPFLGSLELPSSVALEVLADRRDGPQFLRGGSYAIYTSAGWQRLYERRLGLDTNQITDVDNNLQDRATVSIWLTTPGDESETVFSIGQPRRVNKQTAVHYRRVPEDVTGVSFIHPLPEGAWYQSVGSVSVASEEMLRAAGSLYPGWVTIYLELPSSMPTRVGELAARLAAGEANAYDRAEAIEAYVRTIPYDLNVPNPPRYQDTVDYFLFESRRGYFDYHASAMVVMLRSLGIPARLAVGYVLEVSEDGSGRVVVTEQNAFAWPEVYFPSYGWIEFNPTPSEPMIERPQPQGAIVSQPGGVGGETTPLDLAGLLDGFPDEDGASAAIEASAGSDRTQWVLLGVAASLAAVALAAAGGLRIAWVRGLGELTPVERYWEQTIRLAAWTRLPHDPTQTPRERAHALREQLPAVEGIDQLAEAYVRERFGRAPPEAAEHARLEQAWRSVRNGLLRRVVRQRSANGRTTAS
ncbi:MAG: transglutaminase domain-containing protein [Chloroflexi bacterium]|nr:transglutaminase domain-containing protein [Chloroflexota bacterium]